MGVRVKDVGRAALGPVALGPDATTDWSGWPASPAAIAIGAGSLSFAAACAVAASPRLSDSQLASVLIAIAVSAIGIGFYAAIYGDRARRRQVPTVALVVLWVTWLLLASSLPIPFTMGWLLAGLTVPLLALQLFRITRDRAALSVERRFFLAGAALVGISWTYLVLTARQPTLLAPLVKCQPACPRNALFLGSPPGVLAELGRGILRIGWLLTALAAAACVARRFGGAGAAGRRRLGPVLIVAIAYATTVAALLVVQLAGKGLAPLLSVSVIAAAVLPFAALAGLVWERLFMGEALETFVSRLGDTAPEDLGALMAQVLHDGSLEVGFTQLASDRHGGPSETNGELPDTNGARVATAVRGGAQEVVILHRHADAGQEAFIRAAGTAALVSRENHRLETDLSVSAAEVAASRKRLVDAAYSERQRIERDLHDGIQQRIVSARVKLELADETLNTSAARGRRMLAEIGCDLDDALEEVRSLAQGVYPTLLTTHGLVEALRSAARRSPGSVAVRGEIARYPADTEAAVYFCCLETLQNVAKHAGREATATVRLWDDGTMLRFQTRDSGVGFTVNGAPQGRGLVNMHDRLAAVGGSLTLSSRVGVGTVVEGGVPHE